MKENILLYSVCAAITIIAVTATSIIKLIVCSIAKRVGKDMSGNIKEYIFTPIAIILAALGLYIWLDKYMQIDSGEKFVLIICGFSFATMFIYWLIFQPTRKLVAKIFSILKKTDLKSAVEVVEGIIGIVEDSTDTQNKNDLQSNAKVEVPQPKAAVTENISIGKKPNAADSLREMVNALKKE